VLERKEREGQKCLQRTHPNAEKRSITSRGDRRQGKQRKVTVRANDHSRFLGTDLPVTKKRALRLKTFPRGFAGREGGDFFGKKKGKIVSQALKGISH